MADSKIQSEKKPKVARAKKSDAKSEGVGKKLAKAQRSLAGKSDFAVLSKPVITEKSSGASGAGNHVVFRVDCRADKDQIRIAIERIFKVKVVAVNTVNYMGKPKRTTRSMGRRAAYKKAYVTLAKGQSINVIEGI